MEIETPQVYMYMVYVYGICIWGRNTSRSHILYVAKTLEVLNFCF